MLHIATAVQEQDWARLPKGLGLYENKCTNTEVPCYVYYSTMEEYHQELSKCLRCPSGS
jgi:hypothetical protein